MLTLEFIARWLSFLFFTLAAVIHIYFFILESFLYQKPDGYKYFRTNPSEHAPTKIWALNQGFYNLFLAIQMLIGLGFVTAGNPKTAGILVGLSGLFMIMAGLVLYVSNPPMRRGAYIQILPPAVGFLLLILHIL
jgi:putative membrane protein